MRSFRIFLDRWRELKFDERALIRARDEFGLDLGQMLKKEQPLRTLQILICCGLVPADRLAFRKVKRLVSADKDDVLSLEVLKALCAGCGVSFVDID